MTPQGIGHIQIDQPKVLVVEGVDEERLFTTMLESLSVSDIQVLPIGGKTKLRPNLEALAVDPNFIAKVRVLAIFRDADESAGSAFESVCHSLGAADLPVPSQVGQPAGANPIVTVMILPPDQPTGCLEDVCLQAVSADLAIPCLDSYFNCLSQIPGFTMPSHTSKGKAHAFLASREEPDKRLGEAAEAGYWPLDNTAFSPLRDLLTNL